MLIEKKNVAELLPADYNPRKDLRPGDPEYEKLKRSIEQFGYVEPVHLECHYWSRGWRTSALKGSPGHGHDGG